MKKALFTVILALVVLASVFAVPSDVVYSEGAATVKYKTGSVDKVSIGAVYDTGDTVTTGYDGFVELDQSGLSVKINPDTVFTFQEKEQRGQTTGVFSVVLGSIKFRFQRLTGKEPLIQTGSCAAGVRGTEFSVFAGADGSSLIVVDSGQVEVEAEGKAVALAAEEGVEVRPGEPPGEKFAIKKDQIDYRSWNDEKLAGMLADKRRYLYINLRFHSLAALSLRRYVGGRLYLFMKSRYIADSSNSIYQQYLNSFQGFLGDFESTIVPHLVEIDL